MKKLFFNETLIQPYYKSFKVKQVKGNVLVCQTYYQKLVEEKASYRRSQEEKIFTDLATEQNTNLQEF
mgnify:CR=1 FL=1